jgi:hypothetical protein
MSELEVYISGADEDEFLDWLGTTITDLRMSDRIDDVSVFSGTAKGETVEVTMTPEVEGTDFISVFVVPSTPLPWKDSLEFAQAVLGAVPCKEVRCAVDETKPDQFWALTKAGKKQIRWAMPE